MGVCETEGGGGESSSDKRSWEREGTERDQSAGERSPKRADKESHDARSVVVNDE